MAYNTPPRTPRKRSASSAGLSSVLSLRNAERIVRMAGKAYSAYKGATNKSTKQTMDSTTVQADRSVVRVRKSKKALRGLRKKRKFAKKVAAANNYLQLSRTFMKSTYILSQVPTANLSAIYSGSVTWGQFGRQQIAHIPILTYANTQAAGSAQVNDDINDIFETAFNSTTSDTTQTNKGNIYIRSYLCETMIKNYSSNAAYVDVYYYVCKRDNPTQPADLISSATAQQTGDFAPAGNYAANSSELYGWTPYHSPDVLKVVNIIRKERYFMPAGAVTQLEWRGKVNKIWKKEQRGAGGDTVENKYVKGLSRGMICISYGVQTGIDGNDTITGESNIGYSIQKSIRWNEVEIQKTDTTAAVRITAEPYVSAS